MEIQITTTYKLKWHFILAHHYKWSTCKKLFNCQTNKEIKKVVNGGSIGYWIESKFYTLKILKQHIELIPKEKIILPF